VESSEPRDLPPWARDSGLGPGFVPDLDLPSDVLLDLAPDLVLDPMLNVVVDFVEVSVLVVGDGRVSDFPSD
jgi:hypothetical protein